LYGSRSHKTKQLLARAAGTARFAWNWALAEWKHQYKAGERPTEVSLRRQLNAIKREHMDVRRYQSCRAGGDHRFGLGFSGLFCHSLSSALRI